MNNDLISRSDIKTHISELMLVYSDTELDNAILNAIDNAPTVEPFEPDYVGAERLKARQRGYEEGYHNGMKIGKTLNPNITQGECRTCIHRDPEDKRCDCGGLERQGCLFPVSDDYFCKFYEKGGAE